MSQFPNDDDPALKEFLQRHRLPVPPPSPDLEDRIMATIAATPTVVQPHQGQLILWKRRTVTTGAIAASLIVGLIGYHLWLPRTPSPAEVENLEAFLESNWHSAVLDEPDSEVLVPTDPAMK